MTKIKTVHEQSQINIWGADPAGPEQIINHLAAVASGPFGFIVVRHTIGGGRPKVTVFHTVRAYMANPLELNPVDAALKGKVYAFAGEIYAEEGIVALPSIYVEAT
jgi:hypothetical protein